MCLTLEPSRMSGTILYAAETIHEGKLVHVMGYQNRAENLNKGPNAMLLPIPSAVSMGPENAIDMTACKNVLRDYETALVAMNTTRSRGMLGGGHDDLSEKVQVFDSGSYTIVLARDANYINTALEQVPVNKRPKPRPDIFQAYSKLYPGWHIAMCCYDGSVDAEPMVWQYKPIDPGYLFAPALDGHNGKLPDLHSSVQRDHTIITSLVMAPKMKFAITMPKKATLWTLSGDEVPETHKHLFGEHFQGTQVHRMTKNGDIMIPIAEMKKAYFMQDLQISPPPGANQV